MCRRLKLLAVVCKAEDTDLAIASGGGSGDLQASIAKSTPAGTPAISWWGTVCKTKMSQKHQRCNDKYRHTTHSSLCF